MLCAMACYAPAQTPNLPYPTMPNPTTPPSTGRFDGPGIFSTANGSRYVGEFERGRYAGAGLLDCWIVTWVFIGFYSGL